MELLLVDIPNPEPMPTSVNPLQSHLTRAHFLCQSSPKPTHLLQQVRNSTSSDYKYLPVAFCDVSWEEKYWRIGLFKDKMIVLICAC